MPDNNALQKTFLAVPFLSAVFILSVGVVITIFLTTSPLTLGPTWMLGAFLLFYIVFFSFMSLVQYGVLVLIAKKKHSQNDFEPTGEVSKRSLSLKQVSLAAVWAFAPVIMLALQSIGQLDLVSLLLLLVFESLATFYIYKR